MPKKSNTRRADGRIAVQVYLGTVDGKRRYKTVYGATQKEAQEKADELRAQLRRGVDMLTHGRTFSYWANQLLLQKEADGISVGWAETSGRRLHHLGEFFGDMDIGRIRPVDVQNALRAIAQSNPCTGRASGKKTVIEYAALCKQVFRLAFLSRAIPISPMSELVKIPDGKPQTHRFALNAEQQRLVLETDHPARPFAVTMMLTGMRRGELDAVLWSDFDFDKRFVRIDKSYNEQKKEIKSPKTAAGVRNVPLPDLLCDFLQALPRMSILAFPSRSGGYMTGDIWRRMWESYMRKLNTVSGNGNLSVSVKTFTPHCLRHTYATILYDAGVDVLTAKEWLGHADVKTTLDVYTHLSEQKRAGDVYKLNRFMHSDSSGFAPAKNA